jgi:predicted RNA-binding Zn ribbon-like protein
VEFLWVGNHPGIDLCNTVPVVRGGAVDLLADPEALDRWLRLSGWLRRDPTEPAGIATLAWVHRLRAALSEALVAGADRPVRLHAVNDALQDRARPVVTADGRIDLLGDDAQAQLRLDLTGLAAGALALDPARVRRCAGAHCVLVFFDTSRSGTRRWHDMATCGNRAKAATHHARTTA